MKIVAIYDNDGATLDRYTVVTDQPDGDKFVMMLGLAEGGAGVSQWGSGQWNAKTKNSHLGKIIQFTDLSGATQEHIASRVWGAEE